jgi:hypothetical protein
MSVEVFSLIIIYVSVAAVLVLIDNEGLIREVNNARRWEDVAGVRSGLKEIALGVLRGIFWPLGLLWIILSGLWLLVTDGVAGLIDLIRVAIGRV